MKLMKGNALRMRAMQSALGDDNKKKKAARICLQKARPAARIAPQGNSAACEGVLPAGQ